MPFVSSLVAALKRASTVIEKAKDVLRARVFRQQRICRVSQRINVDGLDEHDVCPNRLDRSSSAWRDSVVGMISRVCRVRIDDEDATPSAVAAAYMFARRQLYV